MNRLHKRWRETLRPGVQFDRDHAMIERWDARGDGPGRSICFEGFGLSFSLFVGRTPDARHD